MIDGVIEEIADPGPRLFPPQAVQVEGRLGHEFAPAEQFHAARRGRGVRFFFGKMVGEDRIQLAEGSKEKFLVAGR